MTTLNEHTVSGSERNRLCRAQRLATVGGTNLHELLAMLVDPSWVVRRTVIESLARLGDVAVRPLCEILRHQRDNESRIAAAVDALVASHAEAVAAIMELASDVNPATVSDAAQILGRRRALVAIPLLTELTRHPDDNVAVAAIEALGRIGGRAAVEALIASARSGNFFRTFPAIGVLGRSGDPRVVEPLAQLLDNPSYLPEAARALGRTGDRSAVRPLLDLLVSPSDAVIRVAALSLFDLRGRFEERSGGDGSVIESLVRAHVTTEGLRRLTRALGGADAEESIPICKLLGIVAYAEAASILTATLDAPTPVASAAAEALKSIGRDADQPILAALRQGSSSRRKVLLPAVSRFASAEDVAPCLRDPDPEVRALACDALARLGNASFVSDLFPLLEDSNLRVVHSATAAVQALGSREGRELALRATKASSPVVRRSALHILAYFGDDEALKPILEALEDPDPRVREAAMQGLPYLEDPRAMEALFAAAKGPVERSRALAMRSLGHVPKGNERVYSVLLRGLKDEDAWVRYYACQALGRLAFAPAAAEIAARLTDEAGQVRVSAVEALSHLDSPQAHRALQQAASEEDDEVKRAALIGLGIKHHPEDLSQILAAVGLPDTATRLVALSALTGFPSDRVLGALGSAASDADVQVSSAAMSFLAARPEQEATEVLIELLGGEVSRERARTALLTPAEGRVAGLLVALESADDELAPGLISILSRLSGPGARKGLLSVMQSNNPRARKAAAVAVAARSSDAEMRAVLREAAENDPQPEVRQICSLLLRG